MFKGFEKFFVKCKHFVEIYFGKSPWWGGFYERIIGIVKNCWKKVISESCFRFYKVETVLVEIENKLNSRPLTYMSEDNYAESITHLYLLYRRDINRKNSDINYFEELP